MKLDKTEIIVQGATLALLILLGWTVVGAYSALWMCVGWLLVNLWRLASMWRKQRDEARWALLNLYTHHSESPSWAGTMAPYDRADELLREWGML